LPANQGQMHAPKQFPARKRRVFALTDKGTGCDLPMRAGIDDTQIGLTQSRVNQPFLLKA